MLAFNGGVSQQRTKGDDNTPTHRPAGRQPRAGLRRCVSTSPHPGEVARVSGSPGLAGGKQEGDVRLDGAGLGRCGTTAKPYASVVTERFRGGATTGR